MNLKTMKTIKDKPKATLGKTKREINFREKNTDIASDRGMTTVDLLKHDVAPCPMFFVDGMMTTAHKSHLIKELETYLNQKTIAIKNEKKSSFAIDVMATVRKINLFQPMFLSRSPLRFYIRLRSPSIPSFRTM